MISQQNASTETVPDGRRFIVGQDGHGLWLAVKADGRGGGLFVSKEAAVRYAASECDGKAEAIRFETGPIKLRI